MKHIWRIIRFSGELWRFYAAIGFLTVLLSAMTLVQPLLSGWAIDEIRKGTGSNVRYVFTLAVLIFLMDFGSTVFNNINGYIGDQMSVRLQKILGERYYQHLMRLPQQYFDTELSGKIINRLNRSVQQISTFMVVMSNNFLQFIVSTVLSLFIVAYYSWQIALMLFALYPIFIWMTVRTSNTWLKYQEKKNLHLDIASGRFAEAIGQIKVVKSFISEKRELGYFKRHMNTVIGTNQPQSRFWHIQDVKRRSVLNVIFFGVYAYLFVRGAQGFYTPGQAVALILYAMNIRLPIFTISFLVENTQKAVADSKDYFEVMGLLPAIDDAPDAPDLQVKRGRIEFKDVSFGYDRKQTVLKNVNFRVEPDTKVALVGESGEGKTTLTNLLMRLYEPQEGEILIDGQNIGHVTQRSLREQIGVVFQDPSLFSGSIKENIAYGSPNATDAAIKAAAKAANAHEFIEKFEEGYDSQIGERGLKLSGGQKQRIAIARALLKDAPILILDEATSSLDSKSEAMVQEALHRLMKNRTTIIIAHRLSTIQNVDQIITLRGGTVDEIGSPQELAHSGGIYDQLLGLQARSPDKAQKDLRKFDIQR